MKAKISPLKLPANDHILWLPPETHSTTVNAVIKLYSVIVNSFKLKEDYLSTIEEIKDSKLALEFANLAIKRIETQQKRLLECLLKNYSYEELKDHELFKDYEISEYGSLIHKTSNTEIFFEYSAIRDNSPPLNKIINQFITKENIFRLAVIEKDTSYNGKSSKRYI